MTYPLSRFGSSHFSHLFLLFSTVIGHTNLHSFHFLLVSVPSSRTTSISSGILMHIRKERLFQFPIFTNIFFQTELLSTALPHNCWRRRSTTSARAPGRGIESDLTRGQVCRGQLGVTRQTKEQGKIFGHCDSKFLLMLLMIICYTILRKVKIPRYFVIPSDVGARDDIVRGILSLRIV